MSDLLTMVLATDSEIAPTPRGLSYSPVWLGFATIPSASGQGQELHPPVFPVTGLPISIPAVKPEAAHELAVVPLSWQSYPHRG